MYNAASITELVYSGHKPMTSRRAGKTTAGTLAALLATTPVASLHAENRFPVPSDEKAQVLQLKEGEVPRLNINEIVERYGLMLALDERNSVPYNQQRTPDDKKKRKREDKWYIAALKDPVFYFVVGGGVYLLIALPHPTDNTVKDQNK